MHRYFNIGVYILKTWTRERGFFKIEFSLNIKFLHNSQKHSNKILKHTFSTISALIKHPHFCYNIEVSS